MIGGGETGLYYLRQLRRAAAADRLAYGRILVVDRDARCAVSRAEDPDARLEVAPWEEWLARHLGDLDPRTELVPHHWAPHLLVGWLSLEVERAGGRTRGGLPSRPAGVPFARPTRGGDLALSYATWTCPPTCVEPDLCPHTRGERDWSLARRLSDPGDADATPLVLRCLHLAWGVATLPVADILHARDRLVAGLARGPKRYRVATASHCHGLARLLEVFPAEARPGAGPAGRPAAGRAGVAG